MQIIYVSADFYACIRQNTDLIFDGNYDHVFPHLCGGLDHIDLTTKQIKIWDIGCNGRDHSFIVRARKD